MALVELNRDGMRRAFKRRRKAERRGARAVRFSLYGKTLAAILTGLAGLAALLSVLR